jgi:NADH-ubiquinone oxidoreductase chain 4
MAAPPSLNLVGEVFLLNSIISWSFIRILIIRLLSFFRAAYSLYLFSLSQHGNYYSLSISFSSGSVRENLVLILH